MVEQQIEDINSSEIKPKDPTDYKCAPSKKWSNGSCMTVKQLIEVATSYNENFPANKIRMFPEVEMLNPGKYKRYLVKRLQSRLNRVCDTQKCWIKQAFAKTMDKATYTDL